MPVKSQKQAKYIYHLRGKYKDKAHTPEKYKWVWGDEWVDGVDIKSLPKEIGEDVKKLNEDRFLKKGFYFSSLSTGDKIKKGSKEYTIVSVGADDAYIKDSNGKQVLIKSLKGFEPIKIKSLNEDVSQKEFANKLKNQFGGIYRIKGWNIQIKNPNDSAENIMKFIDDLNNNEGLGYKRFFVKDKSNGRKLIGSVPFGIAITLDYNNTSKLNEDITYPVVFGDNKAATIYYKVEGRKWIVYYELNEPASTESPINNAPVTIFVANKKILDEKNIKAMIRYIQKVNTPNQQLGEE